MNIVHAVVGSDAGPARQAVGRPVLEARGLTKVYGRGSQGRRAVDDVDLTVRAGEVVALLGPNGAGKTTTIKMVAGLVTPTAGAVTILGHDLGSHRGAAVRHLGAVLEGGRNVYWAMSAWQNLLYFGRLRGMRSRDIGRGRSGCCGNWACGSGAAKRWVPSLGECSRRWPWRPPSWPTPRCCCWTSRRSAST